MNLINNSTRRSFRNHQSIKRKYGSLLGLAVTLVVIIISLSISYHSKISQKDNNKLQATRPTQRLETTQLYLKNYCTRSNCQLQHIEALTSILNLMQFQTPNNSFQQNNHSDQQPHQKQDQQFINSNTLIPHSNKGNSYQKANGQSKLREVPLFIIKHQKVTTPLQLTLPQKIVSAFIRHDQYQNIDAIVSSSNNDGLWNPHTKTISVAVRSNTKIRPKTIQIEVAHRKVVNLQLIGLNVDINKNVILLNLGEFMIHQGVSRMNCLRAQCNQGYEALILKLQNASIRKIKMYQSYQD